MKKIKVLQIIPSLEVGGAEKVVLDYLLNQNKGNLEIKAISLYECKKTIYTDIAEYENLDVFYLNKKPGFDLNIIFKISKIIKEYKPDVIHTHLYSLKYAILPSLIYRIKKRFHTIHSRPDKDSSGINKIINEIAFRKLSFIPITLHNNMKTMANEYYNINSSVVLENGVDITEYAQLTESKEEIKKSIGLPTDSFIIGHVGSFKEVKNHAFMIKIFDTIIKVKKDAYLIFAGEGPLKKEIEESVLKLGLTHRVLFLGARSDIPRILKIMDVFLFPSLYEGFPVSLIEAQMSGVKSVVSSNIDESVIISNNVIRLSLDDHISKWCVEIINSANNEVDYKRFNKYTIVEVIKRLEYLYRS